MFSRKRRETYIYVVLYIKVMYKLLGSYVIDSEVQNLKRNGRF
jgi:hypothetical protein